MSADAYPVADHSRLRRLPERGSYERAAVHAILDAGLVCHLGLLSHDRPVVLPMAYARSGDGLILHGAPASRALRALGSQAPACVTVTLLDGLVVARSGFHSSFNYRTVVAFGRARLVEDDAEKRAALDRLVDHLLPGRAAEVRPPTEKEIRGTAVVAFTIEEATAKVRTGPPVDDPADLGLPIWAGVVPLELRHGAPIPAADVPDGVALPAFLVGRAAGDDRGGR